MTIKFIWRIKIAIKDKKSKDNDVIIEDLEQKYKTLEKLMKIKFDELNNEIEDLKSKLAEKIEFKIEPRKTQNNNKKKTIHRDDREFK